MLNGDQFRPTELPWRYTDDDNEPMHGIAAKRH